MGSEQFAADLAVLRAIEARRGLYPHESVRKAQLLQLQDVADAELLVEAKRTLMKALEIEAEYIPALTELGWFFLNVEDDAASALPVFEKALDLATSATSEALVGLARSTQEAQSTAAAIAVIEERSVLRDEALRGELEQLRENM